VWNVFINQSGNPSEGGPNGPSIANKTTVVPSMVLTYPRRFRPAKISDLYPQLKTIPKAFTVFEVQDMTRWTSGVTYNSMTLV